MSKDAAEKAKMNRLQKYLQVSSPTYLKSYIKNHGTKLSRKSISLAKTIRNDSQFLCCVKHREDGKFKRNNKRKTSMISELYEDNLKKNAKTMLTMGLM